MHNYMKYTLYEVCTISHSYYLRVKYIRTREEIIAMCIWNDIVLRYLQ